MAQGLEQANARRKLTSAPSRSPRFDTFGGVDQEGVELANTAIATAFTVTNGVPVVIERAMWWAGDAANWHEGHNTAGATATGEKFGLAEGEVGGPFGLQTYILVARRRRRAPSA